MPPGPSLSPQALGVLYARKGAVTPQGRMRRRCQYFHDPHVGAAVSGL